MYFVDGGVQISADGSNLTAKSDRGMFSTSGLQVPASGLSLTDVIVDAVIVGLLLLILILLFLFRNEDCGGSCEGP